MLKLRGRLAVHELVPRTDHRLAVEYPPTLLLLGIDGQLGEVELKNLPAENLPRIRHRHVQSRDEG